MKRVRIRRLTAICCLVFLITLTVISLTKEMVVRNWIEDTFKQHLNLKVRIQEIYISLFRPRITLDGLYILNPPNYGRHWLANATDVVLDYRPQDLLKRSFHVKKMKLDILEVNIVKDTSGQINLNSICQYGEENNRSFDLSIEKLDLSIRRVTYQDFSTSVPVKVYDINLKNLEFENIKTLEDLAKLITVKILERIGVSQIGVTRQDLEGLSITTNPILQAGSFVLEVIQQVRDVIPG
jgi:hypothetical protein